MTSKRKLFNLYCSLPKFASLCEFLGFHWFKNFSLQFLRKFSGCLRNLLNTSRSSIVPKRTYFEKHPRTIQTIINFSLCRNLLFQSMEFSEVQPEALRHGGSKTSSERKQFSRSAPLETFTKHGSYLYYIRWWRKISY